MATTVYLSNPALTINSVNLTDQATEATLMFAFDQLETSAFGDTARKYGGAAITSLQNNSIEIELYQSYAATETEATIYGLVGITTNVVVAPATGTATATLCAWMYQLRSLAAGRQGCRCCAKYYKSAQPCWRRQSL